MECHQNLQEQFQYRDDAALDAKCDSPSIPKEDPETSEICFDCNICLDSAQDPVVTLCGHLYCWSCIFEWLHVQSSSAEPFHEHQSCPVCKASISHASLVPLYGRGSSLAEQEAKRSRLGLHIPPRPSPDTSMHNRQYSPNNSAAIFSSVENPGSRMNDHPAQMMLGELFYMRILWSFMGLFSDPFPNGRYSMIDSRIPRVRRQEIQAEKFLNRLSIFLFCCFILCWLSF